MLGGLTAGALTGAAGGGYYPAPYPVTYPAPYPAPYPVTYSAPYQHHIRIKQKEDILFLFNTVFIIKFFQNQGENMLIFCYYNSKTTIYNRNGIILLLLQIILCYFNRHISKRDVCKNDY